MMDLTNLGTSIFATGIGATLITQFRGSIRNFFQFFRIGYSVLVNSEINKKAYDTLQEYILKYPGHFHKTTSYEDYNNDNKNIGYGNFVIHSKWNQLIVVNHAQIKRDNGPVYQILTVKIYGINAKKTYQDILFNINNKLHTDDIIIRTGNAFNSSCSFLPKRDFSTIVHPQKQKIIDFLDGFKNKEEIYKKNGLCYKTGILLYGPPGTGKTSMIKAIATYMNYDIIIPNDLLDTDFLYQQNKILCIEDIDRLFDTKILDKDVRTGNASPLQKMLQMFDGLNSPTNTIFIATTNHIEALPEELIRDGRFDCKICLDNIDKFYAEQMCNNFGVKIEDILPENQTYPINPAYLQNKILQSLNPIKEI